METRMKLSELTYEFLESVGLSSASMHTDSSDGLRLLYNESQFQQAKEELMARYGDVNLIIDPSEFWSRQIKIDDAKWQADFDAFCKDKGEWCRKYGSH